ncbi:M56 family metallopeptidase [Kytococcus sp. Marseille-QA3725]
MSPTLVLAALAVLLTLGAPALLPRLSVLRRTPASGLLLWQCCAVGGLSATLLLPVVAAHEFGGLFTDDRHLHPGGVGAAAALSLVLILRLLWAAHTVGTDLRALRQRHRETVDLLDPQHGSRDRLRVIDADGPVAWCLPGRRPRIVMSRPALETLTDDELHGVYVHEREHLRRRHDLVREFFTALDASVPGWLRHPRAQEEVELLVELLADRAGAHTVGALTMGRALVRMGAKGAPSTLVRVTALQELGRPRRRQVLLVASAAVLLAAAPWVVATGALLPGG